MKFMAEDGTIFSTAKACREYEFNKNTSLRIDIVQSVTLYDSKGKCLEYEYASSDDNFWDIFGKAYQDSCYLYINKPVKLPMNEDFDLFPKTKGIFRWDDEKWGWINIEEDIIKFKTDWKALFPNLQVVTGA